MEQDAIQRRVARYFVIGIDRNSVEAPFAFFETVEGRDDPATSRRIAMAMVDALIEDGLPPGMGFCAGLVVFYVGDTVEEFFERFQDALVSEAGLPEERLATYTTHFLRMARGHLFLESPEAAASIGRLCGKMTF